jgi:hypothetical protein
MTPEERELMHVLCEQIAKEKDHAKFTNLVQELNNLLERKEFRLEVHPTKIQAQVPPKKR